MGNEDLAEILDYLNDLKDDNTVSKNVRAKIRVIISILSEDSELSLKINKAMQNLEELSEDVALPSYTRTQIWNITSLLESIN